MPASRQRAVWPSTRTTAKMDLAGMPLAQAQAPEDNPAAAVETEVCWQKPSEMIGLCSTQVFSGRPCACAPKVPSANVSARR